jgi:hypothetical protein
MEQSAKSEGTENKEQSKREGGSVQELTHGSRENTSDSGWGYYGG